MITREKVKAHLKRHKIKYIAAESAGVEAYNMSKHLNGKGSDKVFGKTYRIIGLSTSPA